MGETELINSVLEAASFKEAAITAFGGLMIWTINIGKRYVDVKMDGLKAKERADVIKTNREVDENTIANAIDYVDDVYESEKESRVDLTKKTLALEYIKSVEPGTFERLGENRLIIMITRKLAQNKKTKV